MRATATLAKSAFQGVALPKKRLVAVAPCTRRMAVQMSATPTIYYPTAFRGRAETIKLALAAKGLAWQQVGVTADDAKSDRVRYPFAQFPRFVDDQVDMVQKNAILRHIARRWGLYGDGSLAQAAQVDEWLEGCETMRGLHFKLIYVDKLSDESKKAFWDLNLDRASEARKEGTKPRGAHWFYLERLLERNGGGKGFCVGSQLTVADLEIFELFDIFTRIFPSLRTEYPVLAAHTDRISQIPEIKAYLEGPLRVGQVNANNLG